MVSGIRNINTLGFLSLQIKGYNYEMVLEIMVHIKLDWYFETGKYQLTIRTTMYYKYQLETIHLAIFLKFKGNNSEIEHIILLRLNLT